MHVYTIKDFGSSGFTETTSITIHPTVFWYIMCNNCVGQDNYSRPPKIVDHSVTKISLPPTPLDVLPKRCSRFYMVKVTGRRLRIFCLKFSIVGFFGCLNWICKTEIPDAIFIWTRVVSGTLYATKDWSPGGGYLGQCLLGMCRWPLWAPTPF